MFEVFWEEQQWQAAEECATFQTFFMVMERMGKEVALPRGKKEGQKKAGFSQ